MFRRSGTYIIYADHFNKQSYGNQIYIGQGDRVGSRLDAHVQAKRFWNRVLFFTSDWMNIAHAHNIESEFIESARIAGRYTIDNEVSGQSKNLGMDDKDKCDRYILGAKEIVHLSNIDIFSFNTDAIFSIRDRSHTARMKIVDFENPSVILYANSEIFLWKESKELSELITSGRVLEKMGKIYLFNEDVELQVNMNEIVPSLLGIHVTKFVNTCGVNALEAIKSVRAGRVELSEE